MLELDETEGGMGLLRPPRARVADAGPGAEAARRLTNVVGGAEGVHSVGSSAVSAASCEFQASTLFSVLWNASTHLFAILRNGP